MDGTLEALRMRCSFGAATRSHIWDIPLEHCDRISRLAQTLPFLTDSRFPIS
ncbi:MAG: hypothetical protein F6K37_39825 [Moorea sp. SIO4E2]|uniref:hypothetical protein n=1 Tax=Moorena sp. SIO4E2 TaxID=2607826 RepID=UPI0013BE0C33|nr:hypothetical protein [Moorena sp. SIO4E2]NEQ11801.1 hypothetical protein [Moorena sp. SIO4E2]